MTDIDLHVGLPEAFVSKPAPCKGTELGSGWFRISTVPRFNGRKWDGSSSGNASVIRVDASNRLVDGALEVSVVTKRHNEDRRVRVLPGYADLERHIPDPTDLSGELSTRLTLERRRRKWVLGLPVGPVDLGAEEPPRWVVALRSRLRSHGMTLRSLVITGVAHPWETNRRLQPLLDSFVELDVEAHVETAGGTFSPTRLRIDVDGFTLSRGTADPEEGRQLRFEAESPTVRAVRGGDALPLTAPAATAGHPWLCFDGGLVQLPTSPSRGTVASRSLALPVWGGVRRAELRVDRATEGTLALLRDRSAIWTLSRPDIALFVPRGLCLHAESEDVAPSASDRRELVLRTQPGGQDAGGVRLEMHDGYLVFAGPHQAWVRLPGFWLETPPEWAGTLLDEVTDRRATLPVQVSDVRVELRGHGAFAKDLASAIDGVRLRRDETLYGLRTPAMPGEGADQRGLAVSSRSRGASTDKRTLETTLLVQRRHAVAALDRAYLAETIAGDVATRRERAAVHVIERGLVPRSYGWKTLPQIDGTIVVPANLPTSREIPGRPRRPGYTVEDLDEAAPWRFRLGAPVVSPWLHELCDAIGDPTRDPILGDRLQIRLRHTTGWVLLSTDGRLHGRAWVGSNLATEPWPSTVRGFLLELTGAPLSKSAPSIPDRSARALVGPTSALRLVPVEGRATWQLGDAPGLSIAESGGSLGLNRSDEAVVLTEDVTLAGGAKLRLREVHSRTGAGSPRPFEGMQTELSLTVGDGPLPLTGAHHLTIGDRIFVVWAAPDELEALLDLEIAQGTRARRLNRLFAELRRRADGALEVYNGIIGWDAGRLGGAEPDGSCHVTEQFYEGRRRIAANGIWKVRGEDHVASISLHRTILRDDVDEGAGPSNEHGAGHQATAGARMELTVHHAERPMSFVTPAHFQWIDGDFVVGAEVLLFESKMHGKRRVTLRNHDLILRHIHLDRGTVPSAFCAFSIRSSGSGARFEWSDTNGTSLGARSIERVADADPSPPASDRNHIIFRGIPRRPLAAVRSGERWLVTGATELERRDTTPGQNRLLLLSRRYGLGEIPIELVGADVGAWHVQARAQLRHIGWRREAILETVQDSRTGWALVDSPLQHDDLGFDWLAAESEGPVPDRTRGRVRAQTIVTEVELDGPEDTELLPTLEVGPRVVRRDGETSVVEGLLRLPPEVDAKAVLPGDTNGTPADPAPLTVRWSSAVPFELGEPPPRGNALPLSGEDGRRHLPLREIAFAQATHRPGELLDTRFEVGRERLSHGTATVRCRAPRASDEASRMALEVTPSDADENMAVTATESSLSTTIDASTLRVFVHGPGITQLPREETFELCVVVPANQGAALSVVVAPAEAVLFVGGEPQGNSWSTDLRAVAEMRLHRFRLRASVAATTLELRLAGETTTLSFAQQSERALMIGLLRDDVLCAYGPASATWSGALDAGPEGAGVFSWSRALHATDYFFAPQAKYTLFRMRGDGSLRVSESRAAK